ncbi:MAG: RelA/SpoT domain-containing protein [Oscillospiraceae bacterium]|nr:RelA/SpoT domain-containing protein [Oscillospiraceae bacterium]
MWKKPLYTKRQINDAGLTVISPNVSLKEYAKALNVIDNWRAAHAYPMHALAISLRRKTADITGAVVVQRLKRLDTICKKLKRFPDMNLYRMQDLGGCRVIVPTVEDVYTVKHRIETSRSRHEPKPPKDYIKNPNPSTGYRSVHLIYKYKGAPNSEFNGLLTEIQIRTKLQHLWATTVETVGLVTGNGLKFNQGSERWIEYFKLISALFAIEEGTAPVEGVPSSTWELLGRIIDVEEELDAINKMKTIGFTTRLAGHVGRENEGGYYLLILDLSQLHLEIRYFAGADEGLDEATAQYDEIEKNKGDRKIDAVLVSAKSYEELVDAYPNYFVDVTEFVETLLHIMVKNIDELREMAEKAADEMSRRGDTL